LLVSRQAVGPRRPSLTSIGFPGGEREVAEKALSPLNQRDREFESISLHHPVSKFSDISENRSKSARLHAICDGLRDFNAYMRDARTGESIYRQAGAALAGPFKKPPLLTIFGERNDPFGFQPELAIQQFMP
jgi:hypothetical protein